MPRIVILGVVLLALASALLLVLIPRWVPLPDGVLADPTFATLAGDPRASPWQRMGEGRIERLADGVRLVNDDLAGMVGIDQVLQRPERARAFRVSATLTLEGVVNGDERWQRPRVLVQSIAPGVRRYFHGGYQLIDRGGDFGPRRLSAFFPVSPDHDAARLMIRLQRATGAMELRDLAVVPLEKPLARVILRHALIAVWLVVGAGLAASLWWQSRNRLAAGFLLLTLALIALAVVFPETVRTPLHGRLRDLAGDGRLGVFKPIAHFLGFATLAFAAWRALPHWPGWLLVPAWLAAAALLELAELRWGYFEPTDLGDMAVNATGALIGLRLARPARRVGRPDAWAGTQAGARAGDDPGRGDPTTFRRRP